LPQKQQRSEGFYPTHTQALEVKVSPTKPAAPSPSDADVREPVTQVLALGQLHPDRQYVSIGEGGDLKSYPMRRIGDFGLADQHAIEHASQEFDRLWAMEPEALSEEERARMDSLLERLTKWAIDAPAAAIKKVTAGERKSVVRLFVLEQQQMLQQAVTAAMRDLIEAQMRQARTAPGGES
jgi:hypothetical protein